MKMKLSILSLIIILMGCSRSPTYQGYVEGEFVYVATSLAGRLDRLLVHRGETIKTNTLLFALESEEQIQAQRQSLKILAASLSQWKDLEQPVKRPPELDVIKAQIDEAIANAKKSELQLKRDEEQYAAKGISKGQLDDSRYSHASDVAKIEEMQSELASGELPARKYLIRAQEFQVAAAKAALAQAQWRLDQKIVYSTVEGLVFDTLYRVGDWVGAGDPVIQMLPPQNIKVRFFVPEKMVGKLTLNQGIKIHVDGIKDVEAKITYISTQAEYTPPVIYSNETRSKLTFMIEAHPLNIKEAPRLHPGQPVEVIVLL